MGIAGLGNRNLHVAPGFLAPGDLEVIGDGHVRFDEQVICGCKVRVIAEGRDIVISARAWIGDNAVICANVGANSMVMTKSVVSEDVPANVIVVGNPAKSVWQVC